LARLRAGSVLLSTARGRIEVGQAGPVRSRAATALLVIHGTPGGYDQALAVARLLDGCRLPVLAPSRPGYLGTPLHVGRSPPEQADALAVLLDALQLRRVAVLAVSGGGPAGIELALRHPGRVSCLVLWQVITAPLTLARGTFAQRAIGRVLATDLGAWLALAVLPFGARALLPRQVAPDAIAQRHVRRLAATAFPSDLRGAGAANDAYQSHTRAAPPLQDVRVPTLLVHGTNDRNVPFTHSLRAAATIPGARLVSIPRGTHLTTLLSASAARAIVAFISAATAADPLQTETHAQ
jgi:pimeloyl-ACP methyl ester carboxylesterase